MIVHFCSDGHELHLTKEENKAFAADIHEVYMKHYEIQRNARGIWAGNQGCFVKSHEDLNDWDGDEMERMYTEWKAKRTS